MTPEQLRKIAVFLDKLNELAEIGDRYPQLGLRLYWYDGNLFIDDENNVSIAKINRSDDGYTVSTV